MNKDKMRIWHVTVNWTTRNKRLKKEFIISAETKDKAIACAKTESPRLPTRSPYIEHETSVRCKSTKPITVQMSYPAACRLSKHRNKIS